MYIMGGLSMTLIPSHILTSHIHGRTFLILGQHDAFDGTSVEDAEVHGSTVLKQSCTIGEANLQATIPFHPRGRPSTGHKE
jgi:hypothetical protein